MKAPDINLRLLHRLVHIHGHAHLYTYTQTQACTHACTHTQVQVDMYTCHNNTQAKIWVKKTSQKEQR